MLIILSKIIVLVSGASNPGCSEFQNLWSIQHTLISINFSHQTCACWLYREKASAVAKNNHNILKRPTKLACLLYVAKSVSSIRNDEALKVMKTPIFGFLLNRCSKLSFILTEIVKNTTVLLYLIFAPTFSHFQL